MTAEQNIHLMEEVSNLKKNVKDILKQFTYDAEDHAKDIKTHVSKQNLQTSNAMKVLTKEVIALKSNSPHFSLSSSTPSAPIHHLKHLLLLQLSQDKPTL